MMQSLFSASELESFKAELLEQPYPLLLDNLSISRTVIITAGAAIIFSPLLRKIAPTLKLIEIGS